MHLQGEKERHHIVPLHTINIQSVTNFASWWVVKVSEVYYCNLLLLQQLLIAV